MDEVNSEGVMNGIASIALLPSGSISGHFIHLPHSICYGLHGTELACERECSRGEDYRLLKLTIVDYSRKKERVVVVECKGHDAARFQNIDHAHGTFAMAYVGLDDVWICRRFSQPIRWRNGCTQGHSNLTSYLSDIRDIL
ncbi:PREDICTED: uncharacterized protein LOC104598007 isoform X3 [Nelumbo nucifera]|uniref:Uncharacterized protein LOC104598007 isoform X3 n=1 Tax=Nelumbo nucifera TaxID=4432 RepID=A0A1U8A875_NELNU|nr:PREDICTED: uncharacterized protein LOC104598007 isoform X3 [Nelumbo nucifera]